MDTPLPDRYDVTAQRNDGCSDDAVIWRIETLGTGGGKLALRMSEPTTAPVAIEYPRPILVAGQTAEDLNTCPFASTVIEQHRETNAVRLRGVTCKRWNCPPCARVKIRDLAQWTKLASPNKLLTLTVNPAFHENPEIAWLDTAKKIPELIRELRKRFGPIEYLRVVEETAKGWPHYHMMVRSGFLPQPVIKAEWKRLTGAEIVDIRQVNQFFNSFAYLVKYLTKLHHVKWTDRHVTYSRRFFPVPITPTSEPTPWRVVQQIICEPHKYLNEQYLNRTLQQTAPLTYALNSIPPTWLPEQPKLPVPKIRQKELLEW